MSFAAALPGAQIINRADVEFLSSGGLTNRVTSDPVRTVSQSAPASQINFFDPGFVLVVTNATLGQPLFVQADAAACNLDPGTAETNTVTLTSQLTGDQESFTAIETAANSGLFRIPSGVPTHNVASFPAAPGNGILETTPGDTLTAQLTGCGSAAIAVMVIAAPTNSGAGLFVRKAASRQVAEIGDFIDYIVIVKNVSGGALTGVTLTDTLPASFAFQNGTARLDGAPAPNPAGGGGPRLDFTVGPMAPDATATLTYRVRVGPGALQGDGINHAQAASGGAAAFISNLASVQVRLQPGVFSDRGIVFGKVFADVNANRVQDPGEPGIPGLRLYLEDGTYAITDSEGKYSLYGLSPRTHVIKLDNTTLPRGARLEVLNNRNAGTPGTRFVDLKRGEMHKADFAIASPTAEVLAEINERRKKAEAGTELDAGIQGRLTTDGVPLSRGDPKNLPASGVVTGPPNGGPSAGGPVRPPAPPPLGQHDDWTRNKTIVLPPGAAWPPVDPPAEVSIFDVPLFDPYSATNAPHFTPLLPPGTLNSANSDLPGSPVALSPQVNLGQILTNLDNSPGFVDLKDGDTLPMAQATVRVKGQLGAKLKLAVNGVELPASRIGQRATLAEKQLEMCEFIGVTFRPGRNALEMGQFDNFGNVRGSKVINVIAPDKLGRIKILLPTQEQSADGSTPAKIEVRLEDAHGVPVTARTPLTIEASLGRWDVPDLDKTEPGTQVFIEGGRAEFTLLAPIEPGDSRITASSGAIKGDAILSFLPDLRPMLAVGVIEGQLSLSKLNPNSFVPARSRDGFEEELRDFAAYGNDGKFTAAARAAFFLKGKIKGEYLLTAGFDSEKDTRERLFRDIQPDEFYPVYGDSAVKGFDAQSTGRLYVRIDKRKCYLLYGDYTTQSASEARGLGNYSRSVNGFKEHYEKKNISANLWAAYDSTRQVIEELAANGTSGPYLFKTGNGLVNSEKVEILTRDRHQPSLILKAETKARFTDYEFEPFTGRILFKAPVPSLDANLNPISIRVTYEVDQGGDKFWVYGADAQVKVTSRLEVGGGAVRDENPLGDYGLYSANTTFKLGERTFLLGEVARSETAFIGSGNAERIELRSATDKLDARIYWGRADNTFSNSASIVSSGRIESGAKLAYRLTPNTRLIGQAINTESIANSGDRKGARLDFERTFANQMRLELGGRYSTETAAPAGPSTVGVAPNEVTSLRAKLTAPVPNVKGASFYGEYENDIVEPDKRMVAVGGEYQIKTKSRLYARHEFINALGGPFELNTVQQQNTTVVGLDTEYMKDGTSFNEYRARDAFSGREAEAAMGLRNTWNVAEGLRLNTTFERVNPLDGGNQNEATAVTGGLEYTRNPDWKGTARLELRTSTPNDSLLNTLGYARKLDRNWTFLSRTILYLVDNKGPGVGDRSQFRVQTGLAWRQTDKDVWNALGKYEFKLEDDASQAALSVHRQAHILLLDVNYQPGADWTFSGHYAGKLVFDDSNGLHDTYHAHLIAGRASYDITDRFDLGLNASALFSGGFHSVQYGLGPEIGFRVKSNLRFAVGYNFFGFHDRDLSAENYTNPGVYVALRLKFDEALLGLGKRKEEK